MRQTKLAMDLRRAPRTSAPATSGGEEELELVELMATAIVAVARGGTEQEKVADDGRSDE